MPCIPVSLLSPTSTSQIRRWGPHRETDFSMSLGGAVHSYIPRLSYLPAWSLGTSACQPRQGLPKDT